MKSNPLSLEVLTGIFRTSPKDPTRIINREGSTIEFKESYNHGGMAQYFRAIAAFANNNGGYILFGVGDKPRKLLGLKGTSLSQFESLKVEEFTKNLLEYFSPEIKWDHCTFEFHGMSFGVIYVEPLKRKPCICKKHYDNPNPKYTLKEGDIYYRYGGRSERIRYEELSGIIEETRKSEERQWLNFAKQAVRIGVSNAALLDLQSGKLSGGGGTIVLDDSLLEKIAFIREGQFVETGGTPTLRLIGDVTEIATGKVVVSETARKVVRAIEPSDIVTMFLTQKSAEEPLEYIKRVCTASSANYPVYYFLHQAQVTIADAISLVKGTTARGVVKEKLIERLEGKTITPIVLPISSSDAAKKKLEYRQCWLNETIAFPIAELGYCVESIFYLTDEEILSHKDYICSALLDVFNQHYESATSAVASNLRKAICRIDEVLYFH